MKSFKSTVWLLTQPVLIIGTYNKDGKPNVMNAAWGGTTFRRLANEVDGIIR